MHFILSWTPGRDAQIRRRRVERARWDTIAAELALPMRVVMARACRLGLQLHEPGEENLVEDPSREPLPAGHPASWGAINAQTSLAGQPYPLRTFQH